MTGRDVWDLTRAPEAPLFVAALIVGVIIGWRKGQQV